MPSRVAANGTPLSIHSSGARDARYASKVGEPENIVPASSVVKQVRTNRTTFQTGPRSRGRGGAGGRGSVWPLVVANGSAASGRSVMSSAYHAAVLASAGEDGRAWIAPGSVPLRDPWLLGIASVPARHRGPMTGATPCRFAWSRRGTPPGAVR